MKVFDAFVFAEQMIEVVTGRRVMSGPFRGLRYPSGFQNGNALHAKYLGIYEKELEAVWERLIVQPFHTIIDVGAADGYLAVGSALVFPSATVMAFEQTEEDRSAINILAQHNSVENRVKTDGYCDLVLLRKALDQAEPKVLVIVDIEGGEVDLLNPTFIPALENATLLVETHDFKRPRCEETLVQRFKQSHEIESILSRKRMRQDMPIWLPPGLSKWFLDASSDFRSGQQTWLLLNPRLFPAS